MNYLDKEKWILDYVRNTSTKSTDILSCDFIDKYVKKFKPKIIKYKNWGADYIPELSKILRQMTEQKILHRQVYGLGNLPQGFPNWVYIYKEIK